MALRNLFQKLSLMEETEDERLFKRYQQICDSINRFNAEIYDAGWLVCVTPVRASGSVMNCLEEFIERRARNSPVTLEFYREQEQTEDKQIAYIGITSKLDPEKVKCFTLQIGSNSKNAEIYKGFKEFAEKIGWEIIAEDRGKNHEIRYSSKELYRLKEIEDAVRKIDNYNNLFPSIIKQTLYQAVGIKQSIDIDFLYDSESSFENEPTRQLAKEQLINLLESTDFENALDACKVLFTSLCTGTRNSSENIPFPVGSKPKSVIELADYIYSLKKHEKKLLEEDENLKTLDKKPNNPQLESSKNKDTNNVSLAKKNVFTEKNNSTSRNTSGVENKGLRNFFSLKKFS